MRLALLLSLCVLIGPDGQRDPCGATSVCIYVWMGEDTGLWASLEPAAMVLSADIPAPQRVSSEGRPSRSGRAMGGLHFPHSVAPLARAAVLERKTYCREKGWGLVQSLSCPDKLTEHT